MTVRSTCPLTLLLASLACFEIPELGEVPPIAPDLGPVDTWAALDDSGPPAGDDGPSGGDDAPPSEGGAESGAEGEAESDPGGPDPALDQLRLTELLPDPPGKDGAADSPEFIEILNPGPLPVKLDGLQIKATSWPGLDATKLDLLGLELEVGELLVVRRWATDVDPALATLERSGSVIWTGFLHSGGLRNKDGSVSLEAGTMVIDQVEYGVDPAPAAGLSLCRVDESGATWIQCPPSPGVLEPAEDPTDEPDEPTPIPPGAVQIVEVLANPLGPSSGEKSYEYVEIVNLSENPVELAGCRIGDAFEFDAPGVDPLEHALGDGGCESPTCLAPGARALIVGQGYLGETGGALVLATDDTTIADGGLTNTEPVVLWDPRGEAISTFRFWRDPSSPPVPGDGESLHRIDDSAKDAPESWFLGAPSPGI
ncbi:MAG: lamin tail domain-containing protein [Enhygromyxa sp.]